MVFFSTLLLSGMSTCGLTNHAIKCHKTIIGANKNSFPGLLCKIQIKCSVGFEFHCKFQQNSKTALNGHDHGKCLKDDKSRV